MRYNVQYKIENSEDQRNIEVSVDDQEELVRWLDVLRKLENVADVEFSLVEEDLDF
tara:strand:- start:342 stop:509 length:168 start_codon:yes stop_codon:yes gene_type:complete